MDQDFDTEPNREQLKKEALDDSETGNEFLKVYSPEEEAKEEGPTTLDEIKYKEEAVEETASIP